MKISTKYIVEFSTENITETFALCDSISTVKEYLESKFNFKDCEINNNDGYILIINLDYGKIKVRKVDFVEE
jgi:hypothetical protein